MSQLSSNIANALLWASIDGAALAAAVALLCQPLKQRIPLACVWLWRLVFVKFALGLFGVGIAIGPARLTSATTTETLLPLCITGALAVGLALGIERLWGEVRFLSRLRRNAVEPDLEWRETRAQLCQREGLTRPPRLLASETIELPMAAGTLRPMVVVLAS